jgi:hypothetical protein
MFDPYVLLYWYRRFVLAPLGLSAPVELFESAADCLVGDKKSLLEILKESCPSLIGRRAWYSGPFWLFGSGHFQVSLSCNKSISSLIVIKLTFFFTQTGYSAVANFTKVFRIQYERKVSKYHFDGPKIWSVA